MVISAIHERVWSVSEILKLNEYNNQNAQLKIKTQKAKIGIVLTDPDDWTACTFRKNIRKRGTNALPITLSTLNASISASEFSIFDTDLNDLNLGAIIVRDVGISFSLEQISLV
ncbi:hypothetical protein C5S31_08935 [ANME-1 cluster archaeon GoMg2]|nr:hypothetical protein [ANME-1 cluster archaeon GoMg2]